MAANDFVTAVNEETGFVSAIPRHYLGAYPQYKELTENQIVELRRKAEKEMFGEYKTPAPGSKAAQSAETPVKEGK